MHHHLILSRRPGEKIVVDFTALQHNPIKNPDTGESNLIICTRSISPRQMKLDFYAPETIKIWRQEVWQQLP